ncbi:ZZ-type zinc finger-containing protein P35G2.11c [Holothuria leucospilota]|uniref:ZZ-type zinc finger-containing protein P35G2.11c n=1 Tax=Holothuria leucospilota TaxID=206669 RepID=A0A9Q1CM05_HOLLE|nr:ZZ-type zinc finger-containing protein P35G2.11c [Holothuria leucospilota]
MHIKGYRYRCTKCIFYNLCGWCMSRGEHKEHKFMRYDGREVQHDYIRCDGCGERNIKGDRYRCTICTYFNLCRFCKARGTHTEHTFHIFSGNEPQHNFVKCDGCGEEHIRGNRYRCKTCVYFNLCEWCKNKRKHTEHGFQRFNGSEPLHDFIRCVGCSEKIIRGDRFRCKSCMYINLCTFCKTRGVHNHHDLEKYTGSEFVHYFIDCNSCGEKHIRGDRYRCKTCLSVNICKCCYLKRIHNKHAFTIFSGQEIINHFINCSNCGEIHIRGMRYKCKTCCGFNLCQRCKESGTHKEHELQKFDGNEFVHKYIRCAICGEKHIRGDRYRCKICLYFNLCKCCKENGKHPGHELQIFDGSEFVHSSVVCDNCEEAPMIGKRFKCQTCGNYDLCQCCKEKGVHPDHKFKEISGREYVHKNIQCNGCGERHIKGDRYRCKSCVYFNICKTCRENGEHPEHEFEIFDGSEIAHYFVRCNSCEEGPIIGVRFKCDLCEDYNLCSCCKNKQVHQDHTFKEIATGDEGVEYLMSALSE